MSSPDSPPLYDGLVLGNDPYRYVNPPAGYQHKTPPPSSARSVLTMTNGQVPPFVLATKEAPPQAQVTASNGALAAPRGSTRITVTVRPVKPPTAAPSGLVYDGNVYLFEATVSGKPVTLSRGSTVIAALRGTGAAGIPSLGLLKDDHWSVLPTVPSGVPDDYAATIGGTGYIVLFVKQGATSSNNSTTTVTVTIAAVCLGVLLVTILAIRWMRRTRRDSGQT